MNSNKAKQDPWDLMAQSAESHNSVSKSLTLGRKDDLVFHESADFVQLGNQRVRLIMDVKNNGEKQIRRLRFKSVELKGAKCEIVEQLPRILNLEPGKESTIDLTVQLPEWLFVGPEEMDITGKHEFEYLI